MMGVILFSPKVVRLLLFLLIFSVSSVGAAGERITQNSLYDDFLVKKFSKIVGVQIQPTMPSRFRGSVDQLINNTVAVVGTDTSFGSGVILSDQMVQQLQLEKKFGKGVFIATVEHVVSEKQEYAVIFYDKNGSGLDTNEISMATILQTDRSKDLALLKIKSKPNYVKGSDLFDINSAVSIGDDVQAVGHPNEMWWTYTRGYISQFREGYEWFYGDDETFKMNADVIQTQTPITTGNSGGPLYTSSGKVLGLNAFGDPEFQSINFAVHSNELRKFIERAVDSVTSSVGTAQVVLPQKSNWQKLDELDYNEDGKIDALLFDSNMDGAVDLIETDADFDGVTDYFEFDLFNDFSFALRYFPPTDKYYASWHIDTDLDDQFDLEGSDEDGDGYPDTLNNI